LRRAPRNAAVEKGGSLFMPSTKAATALGTGAILLWATLASLTALSGPFPPFQTTATAFAVGGLGLMLAAILGGRAASLRPTPASLALGIYGLFAYHSLYFAALKLAPPAEAHLVSSLWALLIVLFSALLPGSRLRLAHVCGALLGLGAATLLVWDKLGAGGTTSAPLGFALAFCCALVWSSYSVASRLLASVPSESIAVSCLATAALAFLCSRLFESWVMPGDAIAWAALIGLGAGPVGAAFLLWDIGMKRGDVSLLGALSYASPVLSTVLLVALGFAEATWSLAVACVLMVVAAVIATRAK
jgi:drug/metabolite transporter (DMT)-like permease